MGNGKWYIQFSKILTLLYSMVMFPLSWYVVDRGLTIAEMAIVSGYMGALPYVTAIVGFVQASLAIVLGAYFDNSKKEKVARIDAAAKRDEIRKDF
jgi:TRAP-type C4-dicarboxylate transport system permease small subunit